MRICVKTDLDNTIKYTNDHVLSSTPFLNLFLGNFACIFVVCQFFSKSILKKKNLSRIPSVLSNLTSGLICIQTDCKGYQQMMNDFLKKLILKNVIRQQQKHEKLPSMQRVKDLALTAPITTAADDKFWDIFPNF